METTVAMVDSEEVKGGAREGIHGGREDHVDVSSEASDVDSKSKAKAKARGRKKREREREMTSDAGDSAGGDAAAAAEEGDGATQERVRRRRGGPENGLHQYRGVRQPQWGRWVAEIREPRLRTRMWLGTFGTALEAARAYDEAALVYHGSGARLNLPHERELHRAVPRGCSNNYNRFGSVHENSKEMIGNGMATGTDGSYNCCLAGDGGAQLRRSGSCTLGVGVMPTGLSAVSPYLPWTDSSCDRVAQSVPNFNYAPANESVLLRSSSCNVGSDRLYPPQVPSNYQRLSPCKLAPDRQLPHELFFNANYSRSLGLRSPIIECELGADCPFANRKGRGLHSTSSTQHHPAVTMSAAAPAQFKFDESNPADGQYEGGSLPGDVSRDPLTATTQHRPPPEICQDCCLQEFSECGAISECSADNSFELVQPSDFGSFVFESELQAMATPQESQLQSSVTTASEEVSPVSSITSSTMLGGDAGSPTSFWPESSAATQERSLHPSDSFFWNSIQDQSTSFLMKPCAEFQPDTQVCWDDGDDDDAPIPILPPPPLFDLPDLPNLTFDSLTDVFCDTPKTTGVEKAKSFADI